MALIDCKFFSETLGMASSMRVILPEPSADAASRAGELDGGHPTLLLLHGLSDDETIWTRRTSLERQAEGRPLAIVMPNVHRSFYTNMAHGYRYWDFVSEELMAKARALFGLSARREDTFVAGLSMGGYGAYKLALRHPERFAAAASLSGVMDIAALAPERSADFALIFSDPDELRGGEHDLFRLAAELVASSRPRPKLYQCCGTEDFLYQGNVAFRDCLRSLPFDHLYEEGPGAHDWAYWDRMIGRVLEWLPLPRT